MAWRPRTVSSRSRSTTEMRTKAVHDCRGSPARCPVTHTRPSSCSRVQRPASVVGCRSRAFPRSLHVARGEICRACTSSRSSIGSSMQSLQCSVSGSAIVARFEIKGDMCFSPHHHRLRTENERHPMNTSAENAAALLEDARTLQRDVADLRHRLHEEPEIGLDLPRTQQKVLDWLEPLGYEITLGTDTTSVTAVLRGGSGDGTGA